MFEVVGWGDVSATKEAHEERVNDPGLRRVEGVVDDAQFLIVAAGKKTGKAQAA